MLIPKPIAGGEQLFSTFRALRAAMTTDPAAKLTPLSNMMTLTPSRDLSFGDKQALIGGGWTDDPELGWILKHISPT